MPCANHDLALLSENTSPLPYFLPIESFLVENQMAEHQMVQKRSWGLLELFHCSLLEEDEPVGSQSSSKPKPRQERFK